MVDAADAIMGYTARGREPSDSDSTVRDLAGLAQNVRDVLDQ
jgi:hypothetical protein